LVSAGTTLAYFYSVSVTTVWVIIGSQAPEMLAKSTMDPGGHENCEGPGKAAPPHFFEASAMVLSVLLLGKFLEARAKRQTGDSIRTLVARRPIDARLAMGSKSEQRVPCDLLEHGDCVWVSPGETLPCDGVVVSGDSEVDEAVLTGESSAVRKAKGDLVVGGSRCTHGSIKFEATAVGCNTAMSQIVKMVQEAQAAKPEIEWLASAAANVFVPLVLTLSLLTFGVWLYLVSSGTVEVPSALHHVHEGSPARLAERSFFVVRFALAVMMMACPCAFGLATPTAVMAATGHAATEGCLIKSGRALEASQALKVIVLDKTGTLTVGAPEVIRAMLVRSGHALQKLQAFQPSSVCAPTTIEWLPAKPEAALPDCSQMNPPQAEPGATLSAAFWAAVGSVEAPSEHPLGRALYSHAQQLLGERIPEAQCWSTTPSCGVEGVVPGLGTVRVGKVQWLLEDWGNDDNSNEAMLDEVNDGVVAATLDGCLLGVVIVRDALRPGSKEAVSELVGMGLEVWLCSGDRTETTRAVAKELGILRWVGEALPADKSRLIRDLSEKKGAIGFVGDGVNDAPALATAALGVAIGAGAHVTMEAADVVLVSSEIAGLLEFLKLSRKAVRIIKMNFFWAFGFNVLGLPLAAGVAYPSAYMPPCAAGAAMACSSIFVVLNSLRLCGLK